MARAHPRSRGENSTAATSLWRLLGSSPLTRGKRRHDYSTRSMPGLIPAHAGKTREISPCPPSSRAHPRSRGENDHEEAVDADQDGSSPLTRGKLPRGIAVRTRHGLIPAHAGKTCECIEMLGQAWAHPRSRGENVGRLVLTRTHPGSSPLTRGKRSVREDERAMTGLIPAHAGKTTAIRGGHRSYQAHPRSRGENETHPLIVPIVAGSSPLTRGKLPPSESPVFVSGLIPAHAGKTSRDSSTGSVRWAHPRSRGENRG